MSSVIGTEIGGEGAPARTWKLYIAMSLVGGEGHDPVQVAVAVIVYIPGRTPAATTKEPVSVPAAIAQLGLPTGFPDNEQKLSAEGNPEPVTETVTGGIGGGMTEGISMIC